MAADDGAAAAAAGPSWPHDKEDVMRRVRELERACDKITVMLAELNTRVAVLSVKMATFAAVGGLVGSAFATIMLRRYFV